MLPKILDLGLAGVLMLSAAFPATSQTSTANTNTGTAGTSARSPAQSQLAPVQTQAPQLSQPPVALTSTQPITKVADAERKLSAAKVQDMLGRPVGNIQSVHTNTAGMVTSAQVALNTQTEAGKTVTIAAPQLMYDAHSHIVVAQFVQTEIDAMPATTPQSNTTPRDY